MPGLNISIVTVTYNAGATIRRCIESVIAQNFKNVEHIVIDGGSTDNTVDIINEYKAHIAVLVTEPDQGIYDAMNKGIKLATGNVVGTLNADDFFAYSEALSDIAKLFSESNSQIIYADLDYVDAEDRIVRKWRSGAYKYGMFNGGWMPPHPTFYCKQVLFEQFGYYSLNYGTAADYELMLRFMHLNQINASYLKKVIIKMKIGGMSNKSFPGRVKGLFFDLRAMRKNGISVPALVLILKPLKKIIQYL